MKVVRLPPLGVGHIKHDAQEVQAFALELAGQEMPPMSDVALQVKQMRVQGPPRAPAP